MGMGFVVGLRRGNPRGGFQDLGRKPPVRSGRRAAQMLREEKVKNGRRSCCKSVEWCAFALWYTGKGRAFSFWGRKIWRDESFGCIKHS